METQDPLFGPLLAALEEMKKSRLADEKAEQYLIDDDSDPIAQFGMGEAVGCHFQAVEADKALAQHNADDVRAVWELLHGLALLDFMAVNGAPAEIVGRHAVTMREKWRNAPEVIKQYALSKAWRN